jgi:hypothetical protein
MTSLGDILAGLTDDSRAGAIVTAVAPAAIIARATDAATVSGTPLGGLIAKRVRHLIDHGGDELWLDLVGVMARSPQPASAAVERVLAAAFAEPRPAMAGAST